MSFLNEIAILFKGMNVPAIVCLVLGFFFVVIEIFQPGFGIFGIIGGILSVVGIVLRVIVGDGNVLAQIFILLFIETVLLLIAFLIMVLTSKKGWLMHSPLIEKGTAVNAGLSEGTADYTALIGKLGVAVTDLHPTGKANVDGESYDVITDGFFIKKGEGIKVISAEGAKITVTRAE